MYTKRLAEHLIIAKENLPEKTFLGIFLYGSQNYLISTKESDIDSIAIIIPSFKELVLERPISKEIHLNNGEHIIVKDIRLIVEMWRKQNINFLEILFTDYFIIDPKYTEDWNYFLDIREDIATMDLAKAIKSMVGQAKHTYKQDPNDPKKQANALRMYCTLCAILIGIEYKKAISANSFLIYDVKTGKTSIKDFPLIEKLDELLKFIDCFTVKTEISNKLDTLVLLIIEKHIKEILL